MAGILPTVSVSRAEIERWSGAARRPLAMSLAVAWVRFAPRAKGWGPRMIGRWLGRGMATTIRTRSGGIVAVDSRNLEIYAWAAVHGGVWDAHVHDACAAVARPGDVVFDIGANAGLITMDLASHLRGELTLIAFEPIPSLARGIALSAALNGMSDRMTVCEAMLGSKEGEATLFVPAHAIHASAMAREGGTVELKRPVYTLDALVRDGAIPPPDFIKIDVEGAELEVFRGAAEVLRQHRPAIVFEADENMARFGYTRRALVGCLSECAPYRFYYVTRHGLKPAEDLGAPLDDDHRNLVALPPDRPVPNLDSAHAARGSQAAKTA